jgi:hypothetical protein
MQPHWITFWNCSSRRPDGCLIKHFLCFMWRCSDFSSKGKLDGIFHLNHLWLKNKCPLWRTNMHVNSLPARVYLEFSAMLIHHLRVSSARFRFFVLLRAYVSPLYLSQVTAGSWELPFRNQNGRHDWCKPCFISFYHYSGSWLLSGVTLVNDRNTYKG